MDNANIKLVAFGWAWLFIVWTATYSISMRIASLTSPVATYIAEHNIHAFEYHALLVPPSLKEHILGATTHDEFMNRLQVAKSWQSIHCIQNHTIAVATISRKVSPAEWFNTYSLHNVSSIAKGIRRILDYYEAGETTTRAGYTNESTTTRIVGIS